MKIAVASDLHLEFSDLVIENPEGADVLVLAGDIFIAQDLHDHPEERIAASTSKLSHRQLRARQFRKFIKTCSENFPKVIAIAGNHEFYDGKWAGSINDLRHEYGQFANVHFLERDCLELNGIIFVGGTLWTNLNKADSLTLLSVKDLIYDYKGIRNDEHGYSRLRPANTLSRHRETLEYFSLIAKMNRDKKVVVISHHSPCSLSIHEQYKNQFILNGAYHSDLSEFILDNDNINLWIHGHMHNFSDYLVGDTRVVCNPRGYVGSERVTQLEDPYYPLIVEI